MNPNNNGHRKRLRERFLKAGFSGFSEHEKLEFLLTFAIMQRDCKDTAKILLKEFKTLSSVLDADYEELVKIDGIGNISAVLIKCIKAFSSEYLQNTIEHKRRINNPQDIIDYLRVSFGRSKEESINIFILDVQNKVLAIENISKGTIDEAPFYVRSIVEAVLKKNGKSVILVHNHPSGEVNPSKEDRLMTGRLKEALLLFEINLFDHIIVGDNKYYSFTEKGIL